MTCSNKPERCFLAFSFLKTPYSSHCVRTAHIAHTAPPMANRSTLPFPFKKSTMPLTTAYREG